MSCCLNRQKLEVASARERLSTVVVEMVQRDVVHDADDRVRHRGRG